MFKKKKVEEPVVPTELPKVEEPEVPTETIETNTTDEAKVEEPKEKVELTPEQKKMVEMIKEYQEKYSSIFTIEDFATIRIEPTICNLLLAIYMELKALKEEVAKE